MAKKCGASTIICMSDGVVGAGWIRLNGVILLI